MASGLSRRPRLVLGFAAMLALGTIAGCGQAQPTPAPTSSRDLSAGPSGQAGTASPPTADGLPSAGSSPSLAAAVTVDPGLLEVLPAQIDGAILEPDPTTAAEVASDPLLADSALSIAVALAVAPGASGSDDLAVASVIRLRPDVFDEAFYQEWRDTYNAAACEVADGVESEVSTEIGGRTSYIGTCVGGARTYHVYLEDQGFIVSITATGARGFGQLILAGLAG